MIGFGPVRGRSSANLQVLSTDVVAAKPAALDPISTSIVYRPTVRRLMRIATPLAFGFGVVLRLLQYVLNRSLWLDEAYVTLNITHRSFAGLLRPLEFHQGAPIGFLLLEKWAVDLLGAGEYSLRLLPLLASFASLLLFYKLVKSVLSPLAGIIALSLFAICPSLVYYSSEVKQYSSDVAVALLIYFLAIRGTQAEWRLGQSALLGLVGAIAVWMSHPSAFVLAAVGSVFIPIFIAKKDWGKLTRLSLALLMWAASFGICYLVSFRFLARDTELLAYWRDNFMPLPPRSVSDLKWFVDSLFGFFTHSVGMQFAAVTVFAFLVGSAALYIRNRERLALLLVPWLLTLLASGLHAYPFQGRLTLFLVPSALLLVATGVEEVRRATAHHFPLIAWILIVLLFLDPTVYTLHHFAKPHVEVDHPGVMPPEEIKPVIAYIRVHRRPGDLIYLFSDSQPAFEYYSELYRLYLPNVLVSTTSGDNARDYVADLDRLRGKRVWVVISHIHGDGKAESAYIRFYLDTVGNCTDSFQSPGAVTYVYDLTHTSAVSNAR